MPLNIKNRAAEQAVRELAALTGETVAAAVQRAAEERISRLRSRQARGSIAAELLAIGRRCAALPDRDTRSPEEILGYDDHGLPS